MRESPAALSPPCHSACYLIWQNVEEVEGEIPSYTTNIHDVSTKFRLRAVVIFLAARGFVARRSQTRNRKSRASLHYPKKITTARSLDKTSCINKVIFCFQPGLCCFSYILGHCSVGRATTFRTQIWGGPQFLSQNFFST